MDLRYDGVKSALAHNWWFLFIAVLIAGAGTASSYTWLRQLSMKERSVIAAEKAQEEQLGFYDRTSPTKVAVDLTFPEFIQHLPHLIDLQSVLSVAHKSCTEAGVILVSAQATDSHTPPEQLQRMEINLSLRGDYPKTKQALADVLDHFSNATVEHLALRRGSSPGWIDASVIIAQWGQPILSRPQAASSPTAR